MIFNVKAILNLTFVMLIIYLQYFYTFLNDKYRINCFDNFRHTGYI